MKILTFLIFLCLAAGISAQNKQIYSSAFTAGTLIVHGSLGNRITNGYNLGLEFETRSKGIAVYLNSRINITKENASTQDFYWGNNDNKRSFSLIEVNAGPRFYIGNMKELYVNIDLGFGLYTGSYLRETLWGPQIGAGFNYPVTTGFSLVLNGRLNVIGFDEGFIYTGIHTGLQYTFE